MIRALMNALVFALLLTGLPAPQQEAQAFSTTTCLHGETGTCRLAACSASDIQAAINASSAGGSGLVSMTQHNGDAVYVQACSSTSVGTLTITDKNLQVRGTGTCTTGTVLGKTVVTSCPTQLSGSFRINVTDAGGRRASFRLTNMRFDAPSGEIINFNGGNPHSTQAIAGYFSVDNLVISRGCGQNGFKHYGVIFGTYWGNNITQPPCGNPLWQQSEYLNNEYDVAPTRFLGEWSALAFTPRGTVNNVVAEDNVIQLTGSGGASPIRDSEAGPGHFVFRNNAVSSNGAYYYLYAHWSRANEWDGAWVEIYKNNLVCTGCNGYPIRLESGTGVIYDNQFSGWTNNVVVVDEGRGCGGANLPAMNQCNGSQAWDMNAGDASAPGWPCASQIGIGCLVSGGCSRGNQDNVPLILWNNGTQATCATGGACTNSLSVSVVNQHGDSAQTCIRPTANYIKSTPHTASVSKFNGAVDFCHGLSSKPATCGTYTNNYTPLAYPHPLRGSPSNPVPSKPTNFRITAVPDGSVVRVSQ